MGSSTGTDDADESKQPYEPDEIIFTGCVWRASWNHYGTMLAASYTNNRGKNVVHIIKENEEGKWEPVQEIEA
jgi:hypothetical protein